MANLKILLALPIYSISLLVMRPCTGVEIVAKCECAAFNYPGDMGLVDGEPLLVQNPLNVTCNDEGKTNCENLCLELVKAGKERAPAILCDHIKHGRFKPSLWTRTCDDPWKYSGLTCEKTICCHEGNSIICVDEE